MAYEFLFTSESHWSSFARTIGELSLRSFCMLRLRLYFWFVSPNVEPSFIVVAFILYYSKTVYRSFTWILLFDVDETEEQSLQNNIVCRLTGLHLIMYIYA